MKVMKRQAKVLAAYKEVFSGTHGEAVLLDLMSTHFVSKPTFDGDVNKTIFREGERNVVLRILSILKMDVKAIEERIRLYER